ncbi:MAG TPA: tyrosine-type recombinase/integrase [Azospira sp.]|nr:tyrosine-type recombinase/integrase [Nitrospira sp.]HNJ75656.1 tyrosine-type recombinase/integrase [Azospira sp.]
MPSQRISFTKALLNALPPAENGYDFYFDTSRSAPRGFGIWVTRTGTKTFALYRKVNGRPERMKIGSFPDMTIEQARKRAESMNASIAEGGNPNDLRRSSREEPTLGYLFTRYVERHLKPKTKRWQDSVAIFGNHLAHWQSRRISHLKRSDIQTWHAQVGTNCGHYIANRCLQLIRATINWGIKESGLIKLTMLDGGTNPAAGIRLFTERKRDRFLQPDEVGRFLQALHSDSSADMRDLFMLALLTGARIMNVAAMRWQDVSIERAEWRIPDTKNSESHLVPLVPQAIEILGARMSAAEKSAFVFPSNSVTGYIVSPKKSWRRITDRAGLADLRIHDLRRTLGSWQAVQGASLPIIGKTLGHKTTAATQIYARLNLDPVRESMQSAVGALLSFEKPRVHEAQN